MGLLTSKNANFNKNDPIEVLNYMKTCKNIIVMSGAGISTSAGIPDFRSPEFGLYERLQAYDLPYPEAVFSYDYFKSDPKPFYTLARELYPTLNNARPTKAHYFIRLLNDKGILLRHYTQNIDGLDQLSGLPSDKLIEAHGHIRSGSCISCKSAYSFDFIKNAVLQGLIPTCTNCQSPIKPDVVLFGEGLPNGFWRHLIDFKKCDFLIIMGTSLVVQPFASLAARVSNDCPRLLLNRENVGNAGLSGGIVSYLFDPKFDSNDNSRDAFFAGDIETTIDRLVDLLGWRYEFNLLPAGHPIS